MFKLNYAMPRILHPMDNGVDDATATRAGNRYVQLGFSRRAIQTLRNRYREIDIIVHPGALPRCECESPRSW